MAFLYPWKGSSVAIRTPARKSSPRSSSQFSCAVPDLPGTRSTQPCRGMFLPSCQVHDAGEFTGPSSASVLVVPYVLVNSQYLHACEAGGVIRCGLQTRLDMGPHGIPRSCQLSSQASDGGSLEAQLPDRPADRPHTQTRPGSAHPLVMFQECHRLAGVFATYPASLKPPEPRRDPGPGRVDHLHHHTTVALSDHPTTRAPRQLVARLNIEYQSIWGASHAHQMEALQTDEQITPITTIKRHTAAAGRVRHRPRSLKTAGVEVRSSSRTSTSTRNPRSTPGHPHSTLKSLLSAGIGSMMFSLSGLLIALLLPESQGVAASPGAPGFAWIPSPGA